jgi:nicotinamide riboside kinase
VETVGVIVELAGPAGAGKSTLVQRVIARDARGAAALSIWGLPRLELLRSAIALIPTACRAALGGRPLRLAELAQMMRLDTLRRAVARAARRHPVVLLDEGAVFGLSWLEVFFGRNGDPGFAAWRRRSITGWAELLDLVVLVDAADPALAERIRTREKPHPVKHRPDAVIYDFTATFRAAFDHVLKDLRGAGDVRVCGLATDRDHPDGGTANLLAALGSLSS